MKVYVRAKVDSSVRGLEKEKLYEKFAEIKNQAFLTHLGIVIEDEDGHFKAYDSSYFE